MPTRRGGVHQLWDARVPPEREAHAGFKAAANHCSFHRMSGDTVATLKADLTGYDTSRGTIRFSARTGLPATLVRKLVKTRIAEG